MRRFAPPLLLLGAAVALGFWILHSNAPDAPGAGQARARTIVLITPDTLRRDRVGAYGIHRPGGGSLTPHLDRLAAEGWRFEDARTPVPLTLPGHTTMLSGLPPAATGVRVNAHGRIPSADTRGYALLAERLKAAQWHTAAFVSAAPLVGAFGLDAGFDLYEDTGLDDRTGLTYAERPGTETVTLALAHVRSRPADEQLFLWVHLFDPHAPYAPDAPVGTPLETAYDIDVARTDAAIGQLLDGLRAAGRGDAVVLVAADHGEALDELGERTHGLLLGDGVLRVPFLLRAPGLTPGLRSDPVDLADVAPTLAAAAGLPWPTPPVDLPGTGHDLLAGPVPSDRVRVAETLYAHQRFRWAQLLAAVGPKGTLIDAGADRILWLEPSPIGEPQAAPGQATGREGLGRLSTVLRAYRGGERPDRMRSGGDPAGYGHAGRTAPFLDPEANGALPNPYDAVPRAYALDAHAQRLLGGARPAQVAAQLERMSAQDPGNPEIHFWAARAWERAARGTSTAAAAEQALEAARTAAAEAWRLGRQDADTLGYLVGLTAARQGEARGLELLRGLAPGLPPDVRLKLLEAKLLRALGRAEDADAACEEAAALARRARDESALAKARAEGHCR